MMKSIIWHNVEAWKLENDHISLLVIPSKGGKISSIFDKRKKREWLIGPGSRPLKPVPHGAVFTEQEMCGWDEMFPTIDACEILSSENWDGAELPDHGDIWTQECAVEVKGENEIQLTVGGVSFPYDFWRSIQISNNKITIKYRVTNKGQLPFPYLWAAHPQFQVLLDTEIILPKKGEILFNAVNMPQWGSHGKIYHWPESQRVDGKMQALNRIRSNEHKECHKFYIDPEVRLNWAELRDISTGNRLTISWDDPVRYLGILVDEGKFNPESVAALEPSTGFYDDLSRAVENDRFSILYPNKSDNWQLEIAVGSN